MSVSKWMLQIISFLVLTPANGLSLSPVRQFYANFNDLVDERISHTLDDLHSTNGTLDIHFPIVHSKDLLKESPSHDNQFCSGCIVRLSDEETIVVKQMWQTIQSIPFVPSAAASGTEAQRNSLLHQQLTLESGNNTNVGSDYVHYPSMDKKEEEVLRQMIGENGLRNILNAYQLIANVGKHFCVAACAQSNDGSSQVADNNNNYPRLLEMFERVLGKDLDACFQRLARYRESTTESLRPHCDWSFVTIVPVSSVSGLKIYHNNRGWICPEDMARHLQHDDNDDDAEHARYLVVMPGKWLEVLTNGRVPSMIHRVEGGPLARFSAPLFLRPQPQVFQDAEALVLENSDDIPNSQAFLSKFLLGYQRR